VNGYIPKSLNAGEIASALRDVMNGSTYVPLSVTRRDALAPYFSENVQFRPEDFDLTERQRHVLDELLHGKSSKEIGRALDITESTVKIHLAALYRTLRVKTRSEAIAKMKRAGFAQH
jgi:DNA-binding NarL/FixJ family response regulator